MGNLTLEIIDENGKITTLTDSRDIINYCKSVKGGDRLLPKNKEGEINEILDLIYDANGGMLSFKSYSSRDPIFNFGLNKIMSPLRGVKVRGYLKDPNIRNNPKLKKIYEDALKRLARPGPSLEELLVRANKAMSLLDDKLKDGPWLLGKENTAVDCVASIWVQWIVWSNAIKVTPRVMDFLQRSRERPSWKKCEPSWVIPFVRVRIYAATAVLSGFVGAGVYLFAKKYGK